MTRVEALPYRTPAHVRIKAGDWQLSSGGELVPLPELLPHWDPNTPVAISRRLDVDFDGLLKDCGLSTGRIHALIAWHSPGTTIRGASTAVPLDDKASSAALTLKIDGSSLALSLVLEAQLVLIDGKARAPLAPRFPGSVLWRDRREIVLEGAGTRFPVELCDFQARAWLPENAGWYLDWDSEDLEQPVLGGVRLLVNTRHERVRDAIEACSLPTGLTPGPEAIVSALYHDVGRVLILGALANEDFVSNPRRYPAASVGRIVANLITTIFPGRDIAELGAKRQSQPFAFECELQDRLRLFGGRA